MKENITTGDKYKGIYRIPPARWQDWDYGANAAYFVTICTASREQFFGEINDGEMTLSEIGQIASECWTQIPAHFPFAILGTFVVMPNHVHGVIVIDKPDNCATPVETLHATSLQCKSKKNEFMQSISHKSHSLSAILRSYKSAVTKRANMNGISFAWQTRFHDRVIRDYNELSHIEQYIDANIFNWHDDELYG
ncbi:MAG: hypothetical protein LBH19_12515 [Dysgonamonadaceae bacterium]|jgi:REP element-mobilizing transposase RayT|nr:hypothetical protein [Dysgonamonadaceae bacterium]